MLLSEALAEFLKFQQYRRGAAKSTIATYHRTLLDFLTVVGNVHLVNFDAGLVDRYADALLARGVKPKTFRNRLSTIRSLVNYLWVTDQVHLRPEQVIIPKFKETEQEANFLTPDEVKKLLRVIKNKRDKAMVMVLIDTCTRVSEFVDLRIEDLFIRSIIVRNGKGGKRRPVFITPETERVLNKYLDTKKHMAHGYLFPNPQGNRLSRIYVTRKVSYYAQRAKIPKTVSTHTLRHTGLTRLLWGGARVEDVQKIAGHSNIRTTMIYLHFTDEGLHKTFDESTTKLKTLA